MPTEIQWRLRPREQWIKADSKWQHHSMSTPGDVDKLIEYYNLYDGFFEYRRNEVVRAPQPKPATGPFAFSFGKKGKGPSSKVGES